MKNIFWEIVRSKLNGNSSYIAEVRCKNKKTLDIGCGFGGFLSYDPENFIGIDINEEALSFCNSEKYNVRFGSANKLPFPNESFDAIVALQVIEHLTPEVAYQMFKEVERVLRFSGEFIISTEMPTKYVWDTFSHVRPYSPKSIEKILAKMSDLGAQESFKKISDLRIVAIYYNGKFFRNTFFNIISQIISNLTPFNRINYTMVIRKEV